MWFQDHSAEVLHAALAKPLLPVPSSVELMQVQPCCGNSRQDAGSIHLLTSRALVGRSALPAAWPRSCKGHIWLAIMI